MNIKYLLLAAISGAIITIDQASKMFVHTRFELNRSNPVISGFFDLTYVRNPGAAFGFLAESQPWFREIFFLSMPPVALLIILMILRGVQSNDRWTIVSLSMVFAGAIGNYIDRLRFRYVIDFLDFYLVFDGKRYSWPAFNVADMAIVGGVAVLLYFEFTRKRAPETEESSDGTVSAGN